MLRVCSSSRTVQHKGGRTHNRPPATQKQAGKPSTQLSRAVAPCFQDSRAHPSLSQGLGGVGKCFLVGVAVERVERLCRRNELLVS